jgi:hypothetical protein
MVSEILIGFKQDKLCVLLKLKTILFLENTKIL